MCTNLVERQDQYIKKRLCIQLDGQHSNWGTTPRRQPLCPSRTLQRIQRKISQSLAAGFFIPSRWDGNSSLSKTTGSGASSARSTRQLDALCPRLPSIRYREGQMVHITSGDVGYPEACSSRLVTAPFQSFELWARYRTGYRPTTQGNSAFGVFSLTGKNNEPLSYLGCLLL